ncbi:TPA: hypothetical protein N3D36_001740 [Salmonella enterica subsp. enterica serovar Lehrte]|nr:hypothetical protein [Salmonella enterica subsp. enterica serovar Agbeni]HCM2492613.1 hypothetical protein [Salmonella enterica subsp. enterica serovar Lehrte]
MCGGSPSVDSGPSAEEQEKAAADKAAQQANADTAARRKRKKESSLLTTGAEGTGNSVLGSGNTAGKSTTGA